MQQELQTRAGEVMAFVHKNKQGTLYKREEFGRAIDRFLFCCSVLYFQEEPNKHYGTYEMQVPQLQFHQEKEYLGHVMKGVALFPPEETHLFLEEYGRSKTGKDSGKLQGVYLGDYVHFGGRRQPGEDLHLKTHFEKVTVGKLDGFTHDSYYHTVDCYKAIKPGRIELTFYGRFTSHMRIVIDEKTRSVPDHSQDYRICQLNKIYYFYPFQEVHYVG
jgi:hypothetical protein